MQMHVTRTLQVALLLEERGWMMADLCDQLIIDILTDHRLLCDQLIIDILCNAYDQLIT